MMNLQTKIYVPCYYAFFSSGFSVLLLGAVIPYLISEYGISYTAAGTFVSCYSLGNLAASFFTPPAVSKFGIKTTIGILSAMLPIGFSVMLFTPAVTAISVSLFIAGIGRGSVANINNYLVNEYSSGKAGPMNVLHMFFAVGAFCAPLLTSALVLRGAGWKYAVVACVIIGLFASAFYMLMPLKNEKFPIRRKNIQGQTGQVNYWKSPDFYISCALLFCYVGLEYSVNGWFITYFRQTGIMSQTYAANLMSIMWVVIIFGRLANAAVAGFINKKIQILINVAGCAFFLVFLFAGSNVFQITVSIIGMGFFMAGIYPTCVANAGLLLKGSATGMAIFLAVAGIGGTLLPQLVGALADKIGIAGAMSFLLFDTGLLLVMAVVNLLRRQPHSSKL